MKTIKRILMIKAVLLGIAVTYLAFSIYLDSIFIRSTNVDLTTYFHPGDKFGSKFEGFDQTVLGIKDGWVRTRLEVAPFAGGPPEHAHKHFTETFTVKKGTLSIMLNGEKRTLREGESISIPPMTSHKPFNETGETVIVESDDEKTLPIEFAYHLTQIYGFMDRFPDGPPLPHMLMQLSVFGDRFDSVIAGPPVSAQRAMQVLIAPTARLAGYRDHYDEYRPRHRSEFAAN